MGHPKKRFLIVTPLQRMYEIYGTDAPIQSGADLVNWLNRARSSSPAQREAAERVRRLISNMHRIANGRKSFETTELGRNLLKTGQMATMQVMEPFYKFNFDLYPPRDFGRWSLLFTISASNTSKDGDQSDGTLYQIPSFELGAVSAVVDLALHGRLETIGQCQVAGCGEWFAAEKNDPRTLCCPAHTSDDLRKGTPQRKEQLRAAAKDARENAKKQDEAHWGQVRRKDQLQKPSSRRAQR